MVAKRETKTELSYEEQVAIARANLERHTNELRREIDQYVAAGGDPAADLNDFVRKTFEPDGLLQSLREWRAERGKPDLDEW
ncbi:MAG: hypothetical protein H0W06_00225 [Chloroflexia bacterium]|nr:hypothetical protein [Chloroflexia bacterium]